MPKEKTSKLWSRLVTAGWCLLVLLLVLGPFVAKRLGWNDGTWFSVWILVFIIILLSFRSYVAERHRNIMSTALSVDDVLAQHLPTIVYLRSFDDDQCILRRYRRAWPTEDEQIARAFAPYGALVAIADATKELSALGAAHLIASNDNWKEKVKTLVDNAAFVLVRLGDSPGVLWELKLVIRRVSPGHVLLLSALTSEAHANVAVMLEREFGICLPAYTGGLYVITFAEDWTPTARLLHKWNLRGSGRSTYLEVGLRAALVPFFRRLGFPVGPPPVLRSRIANVLFICSVSLILCWGGLFFPVSFVLEPPDHATMSAGFAFFLGGAAILGIFAGVVAALVVIQAVREIWFPQYYLVEREGTLSSGLHPPSNAIS
jgi:hypothetical protein